MANNTRSTFLMMLLKKMAPKSTHVATDVFHGVQTRQKLCQCFQRVMWRHSGMRRARADGSFQVGRFLGLGVKLPSRRVAMWEGTHPRLPTGFCRVLARPGAGVRMATLGHGCGESKGPTLFKKKNLSSNQKASTCNQCAWQAFAARPKRKVAASQSG